MNLKRRAINSSIWIFLETVVVRGVLFLTMLYLARLLGPEEFGLFGMMAIFIALGNALINSGMGASLIRNDNVNQLDFSTVFYTNILFSIAVYLIVYFSAPLISDFYGFEELILLIRVYSVVFIISGFNVVQTAIHTKNLEFRKLALFNIPGLLIGSFLGVYLSKRGYGIWSVIFMQITIHLLNGICIWLFSKWLPSIRFSKSKMREHIKFGYKLSIAEIINVTFENSYFLVIGKFFPIREVGFFERSRSFTNYPTSILTGVVSKVTFPLLVKVRNNSELIIKTYYRIVQSILFVTTPLMLGGLALSHLLVKLILGEEWLDMVAYMQILFLASILHPLHVLNLNVLKVFGRSDLFLKLEIVKKTILIIFLLIGVRFGVVGIVYSVLFTSVFAFFINAYYNGQFLGFGILEQLKMIVSPLVLSAIMATAMYYFSLQLIDHHLLLQILIPSILGLGLYVFLNIILRTRASLYLLTLIKDQFLDD